MSYASEDEMVDVEFAVQSFGRIISSYIKKPFSNNKPQNRHARKASPYSPRITPQPPQINHGQNAFLWVNMGTLMGIERPNT